MKNTSTKDKKEYLKRYREKNKEKLKEHQREYYQKNKEKILEHIRNYYKENKEKLQNKHNNRCDMDCFNCIYDDCIMP